MCILEELAAEALSVENILKYIDDYSIYSHYIGKELELSARYSSPLRQGDDNPSFSLFKNKDRIFFKDHATTWKGDVFNFVRIMMGKGNPETVPFPLVLQQIDSDFNLGLYTDNGNMEKLKPVKVINIPEKERYYINITSYKNPTQQFIDYWLDKYDITKEILDLYNCTNARIIHYSSRTTSHKFQSYPKTLCIAYQIGGRYKLYFPFEKKDKKFRNDFPANWVEGMLQLKHNNDFIIITKAMKEVMFFRQHFDWDAVAGKSENTKIPVHIMNKLFRDYKKVYIWLDKDEAGIKAQKDYLEKYPKLIPISYKDTVMQKDPTDRYEYLKQAGLQKIALQEIINLIV